MLHIRVMNLDDVPLGCRLNGAAGWNQLPADWQRLLALEPAGCFVAEWDGQPVGTTCVTRFDTIAWISMVLVDAAHRGRGIGTQLMRHAIAWLDQCGARTVRLDATALGRPVYEKLGFVGEYEVARWEGTATGGELRPEISHGGRREPGGDRRLGSAGDRHAPRPAAGPAFRRAAPGDAGGRDPAGRSPAIAAFVWAGGPGRSVPWSRWTLRPALPCSMRRFSTTQGQAVFLDVPLPQPAGHAVGRGAGPAHSAAVPPHVSRPAGRRSAPADLGQFWTRKRLIPRLVPRPAV